MMKSKLKVVTGDAPAGAFEALIKEAAAAALEVRALDSVEGFKLTAADFLREADAIAGTDAKGRARLRALLDDPVQARNLAHVHQPFRRMVAFITTRNVTRPTRELRRLNFLMSPEAIGELAGARSSTFELFALAVEVAGEKNPGAFGTATSSKGADEKLVELTLKRDALFDRVASEWTPADVEDRDVDNERGTARTCFKLTNGAVNVHPLADCGRRLVDWWASHKTESQRQG